MKIKATIKHSLIAISSTVVLLTACTSDPLSPGIEFMPDMYRGPAYEAYSEQKLANGTTSLTTRTPANHSIPRGFTPYGLPNTIEAYEAAATAVVNPIAADAIAKAEIEGKELYTKNCIHCHGEKGDGVGSIKVKGEAFPVPSYYDDTHKNLADGKMYHTLMYGKGLMGSHASIVNNEERWKLIAYVNKLQREGLGVTTDAAIVAPTDSTKSVIKK